MCPDIEIIVGTYEEYLLGYQIVEEEVKDESKMLLRQTFADKSHAGAIKCISVQGPWPKILPAHAARVKAAGLFKQTHCAGEIKVCRCQLEKRELTFIASTSIGCRPTSLGLVDLSLIESTATRPKQGVPAVGPTSKPSDVEPGGWRLIHQKGFVTIEFDDDAKPPPISKKAAKKQQKAAKKPKKAEIDFDENSSDGESEAFTDSDSDSNPEPTPKKGTKKSAKAQGFVSAEYDEDANADSSDEAIEGTPKPKARKSKEAKGKVPKPVVEQQSDQSSSDSDSVLKRKRKQPPSHASAKRKVKKQTRYEIVL
ncbi:GL14746 [Drosophila persimilis]|uniref:GL14746 n=1 Tax=Drosophila persimilis TaxID=7234 RepID=B4GVY9_DROPE|nr:GL14746 [Drosophila persimilis]